MSFTKGTKPAQQSAARLPEAETAGASEAHAPRKLTLAENAIMTIKVLAGFGLLGVALWAMSLWTSPK